ncbi:small multi-drug export protein [Verrucomicrobiota bacterium]
MDTEDKTSDTVPTAERPLRRRFLHSEEGSIFAFGCCMLILWIEAIAMLWRCNNPVWLNLLTMGFTHVSAGRGASVALAMANINAPGAVIAMLAIYLDVMVMLIMYPILVFSYKNFVERRFFQEHMKHVFESAQKSVTRLRRSKILGVFLFVWFPLSMTGIVVGSVLGFLLGLRTWVTITTVVLGSSSAVICWVYAYDKVFGWLGEIDDAIPLVATLILILVLVVIRIITRRRRGEVITDN